MMFQERHELIMLTWEALLAFQMKTFSLNRQKSRCYLSCQLLCCGLPCNFSCISGSKGKCKSIYFKFSVNYTVSIFCLVCMCLVYLYMCSFPCLPNLAKHSQLTFPLIWSLVCYAWTVWGLVHNEI